MVDSDMDDSNDDTNTESSAHSDHDFKDDVDLDDSVDDDLDIYHDFLLSEMGLNHEDIAHKEDVDYLVHVLEKYDLYMSKMM